MGKGGGGGEKSKRGFEETELRLGIGIGLAAGDQVVRNNKRCFSETDETTDLKLNLSAMDPNHDKLKDLHYNLTDPAKPPAPKAQVVGWPPVRSFRKNMLANQKSSSSSNSSSEEGGSAAFVKVSMDGAPYLRKVDLRMYKSYHQLSDALAKMFTSFTTTGNYGSHGITKDFMNERNKLMDVLNGPDYVPTYEDKDCDWMLVGDVPWDMFVKSCKRLCIMKGTEAIGLAPKAMEKCKNRS